MLDLSHSTALEGGRIEINLNVVDNDAETEEDESGSEEEDLPASQSTKPIYTARGALLQASQPEDDEAPAVRQGSSRSGKRRKLNLPGDMRIGKRIKQKLVGSDDEEEEEDDYNPPGVFNINQL